jgi:ubiquinone/menaquinone biosynthesis C-methylase UbiE
VTVAPTAAYDQIADWYEQEFLAGITAPGADRLGIDAALDSLLGPGAGACLEIGCGTGVRAARVRDLGWTPLGIDISAAMLRHARGRLPAARADAARLPVRDRCLPAVITVMAHTDMPAYPGVLAEAARVLQPGGRLVHIGVHPCFCGGFADRSDPASCTLSWTPA